LFLLAGYELDPRLLRAHPGRLAIIGWLISAVIAVGAVAILGFLRAFVPIGLALTTTALGTLLPILHDHHMLSGDIGRYVLAAGAVGELFPIVAISLFLTGPREFVAIASILAVGVIAILLTLVPRIIGPARVRAVIRQGRRATSQTTLRWSIVLLLLLLVAAQRFGLDVVLGAMLAGMVLRSWTHGIDIDVTPLEGKLDAVGYGFFIPVFFVASGMALDVQSIAQNPLRLLVFFVLLLVVRGLPSLPVYRRALPLRQRAEMTFITATTMPLLIALAAIGLSTGGHDSRQRGGPGRRRCAVGARLPVDRHRAGAAWGHRPRRSGRGGDRAGRGRRGRGGGRRPRCGRAQPRARGRPRGRPRRFPGRVVGLGAALFVPLVWGRISRGGPMISIGIGGRSV
jgi:Kef-type K+ transport system membrane component KefB